MSDKINKEVPGQTPDLKSNSNRNESRNVSPKFNAGVKTRNIAREPHQKRLGTREGKPGKVKSEGSKKNPVTEQDLEWNIQDELANGHYKLNGRKTKISINHLLDFQLPEIERSSGSSGVNFERRRRRKSDNNDRVYLHGDSFVNANYKFLVDDQSSYSEQSSDPNIPLKTESIVRVLIPKGQNCPICLTEYLISPRMVICGHVFCQTCLLQLFKAEPDVKKDSEYRNKRKKDLRECPLCSSIIKKNNIKPVLFTEEISSNEVPKRGSEVELQLMCKPHGSLLPLPVNLGLDPLKLGNFPSFQLSELTAFSRIMKCDTSYAITLLEIDNLQIKEQFEIDKALYNDTGDLARIAIKENTEIINLLKQKESSTIPDVLNLSLDSNLNRYDDSSAFFFYETGFNSPMKYYLSSLDIKILKNVFHNYHSFPNTLKVKIEDIHYGSMVTENTITKFKYFSHLPIGTELAFIDLNWRNEDIIPKEIYTKFSTELKQRHRKIIMKRSREDKEKRLYEEKLEQEHLQFYQRENGEMLPSVQQLPQFPSTNTKESSKLLSPAEDIETPDESKHKERTVWGTQIVITDQKAIDEDLEFQKMLSEAAQSKGDQKKGRKGKGKTLILSNTSMRSF